jgi:hypothetical protein
MGWVSGSANQPASSGPDRCPAFSELTLFFLPLAQMERVSPGEYSNVLFAKLSHTALGSDGPGVVARLRRATTQPPTLGYLRFTVRRVLPCRFATHVSIPSREMRINP